MHCYRLEAGQVRRGLLASAFPVTDAVVRGGLIREAAVALIVPRTVEGKDFRATLEWPDSPGYQFGEAWLQQPERNVAQSQDLLIAVDWREHWPDRNLGDASTLVTWNRTHALYLCRAGTTFLRHRTSGVILANEGGEPVHLRPESYSRLLDERRRRLALAVTTEVVVFDRLIP